LQEIAIDKGFEIAAELKLILKNKTITLILFL
jgi:hypothetical protein